MQAQITWQTGSAWQTGIRSHTRATYHKYSRLRDHDRMRQGQQASHWGHVMLEWRLDEVERTTSAMQVLAQALRTGICEMKYSSTVVSNQAPRNAIGCGIGSQITYSLLRRCWRRIRMHKCAWRDVQSLDVTGAGQGGGHGINASVRDVTPISPHRVTH